MKTVEQLTAGQMPAAVAVLCDAFRDYPVMRYVLGDGHEDVDRRLSELIGFFVFRRVRQGGPLLGISEGGSLVAAAVMTLPAEPEMPSDVLARRDALWRDLGDDTRLRYESYANTTKPFFATMPAHHHLNMIGVRRNHAGSGFARPLLETVAEISRSDPGSCGVSLTTEATRNLSLYQHFGYRIVGHGRVSTTLEAWGLFRASAIS